MGYEISEIVKHFNIEGEYIYSENYGCGHINDTYAVYFKRESQPPLRYIVQRINTEIFDEKKLMHNVTLVTDYLKERITAEGGNPERNTLSIVKTNDGRSYFEAEDGSCWRVYIFIENTVTYQSAVNEKVFENSGRAFGHFQRQLSDFDASKLYEVITDFHNTRKRFEDFKSAVKADIKGRTAEAKSEIGFAMDREKYCDEIISKLGSKEIPLRVTHNDTKLNNILIDPVTGEGICIIDLDTVMPGSLLYDFGDSNRFGANTALEDETDLSKVSFSMDMFRAYTKGFISEVSDTLTDTEAELLPFSCILMTFEVGIRFLTDYLEGDTYFKTTHAEHNLERARNQFHLVKDMESKLDEMQAIVSDLRG